MRSVTIWLIIFYGLSLLAQETPPYANITSVDFRGTGCDAESARVSITPDLQYFSILYDRFSAEVGTGSVNPQAKRDMKNCIVTVNFDLPPGWSLQFEQVEYRGFVSLPNANDNAVQMIGVETSFGKSKDFASNMMKGPKMENFVTTFNNPIENVIGPQMRALFGPGNGIGKGKGPGGEGPPGRVKHLRKGDLFDCSDRQQNAVLRIRSRLMVSNQTDPGNSMVKIVVDSTDASFKQKLKINWNKCLRDN